MPGSRTSAIVKYHNDHSAYGMALKDMQIYLENGIVGSNSPALSSVNIGSYITVCGQQHILIGRVTEYLVDEHLKGAWERCGGRRWIHNFKMEWLTPILQLTTLIDITLKEICDNSGVDHKKFFHPICHSSNYKGVVLKLLTNIV